MIISEKLDYFNPGDNRKSFSVVINNASRTVSVTKGKLFFSLKRGEESMFTEKLTQAQKVEIIDSFSIVPKGNAQKLSIFFTNKRVIERIDDMRGFLTELQIPIKNFNKENSLFF